MLSNREIASLLILGIFVLLVLIPRDSRKQAAGMVKILLGRHVLPVILIYFAYSVAVIWVAAWLGGWGFDLLKDTVLVVLLVGLPLLFQAASTKAGGQLVRRTFAQTIGVSAVVLFYVNLVSLPLLAEIAIQIAAIVLSALSALASSRPRTFRVVVLVADALLAVVGISLLVYTTTTLWVTWQD